MMENNELQHWGVRGMRWGVRRYQNKDGTLTKAGKKRYNKELAKLREEKRILDNKDKTKAKFDKLETMRKEIEERKHPTSTKIKTTVKPKTKPTPKTKKLSDMSNEELAARIDRLTLEARYKELNPQQVDKGREFLISLRDKAIDDLAIPVIKDVSKSVLKGVLNKKLDIDKNNGNKNENKSNKPKKDDDD